MIISAIYILGAIILFYFGANWLVKGSSFMATAAGISPFLIGLTVVAFGISSPELIMSIRSTLEGKGSIAIANVVGSNLFNICIILGISVLISPLKTNRQLLKINIPVLIAGTIGFMLLFIDRHISRMEGIFLVIGLISYTVVTIFLSRRRMDDQVPEELRKQVTVRKPKWYLAAGMVIVGIGMLVAGSELLFKGAFEIANSAGVGESIIGITIIAASTSFPLLVFSIFATRSREYDVVIGTLTGAGIFNILGSIGISAVIKPLSSIALSNIDLYIMSGITLLLIPFLRKNHTFKRDEGYFLIGIYLIYLYYLWPK